MSRFFDKLVFRVEPVAKTTIILTERLRYIDRRRRMFTVPAGFKSDLASVPKWLRSVATPWNQSARAGVLHDCGYRWFEIWRLSRRELDLIYMQALMDDGVSRWRAWIQKMAVRVTGGRAWNNWRLTPFQEKGLRPPPIRG